MKSFLLKLIAISMSIVCVLSIGLVSALNQDEAYAVVSWSSTTYYPGDTMFFRILFQSNSSDELQLTRIGLWFDWMAADSFYSIDLSASPVSVPSYKSFTSDMLSISVPSNVSVGPHTYIVGIDGLQNNIDFTWDSSSATIQIHDARAKAYDQLAPQVESKIAEADNATYKSSEAKSLLQQAKDEYDQAGLLAHEGQWQEAVTHLQNASDFLDQAATAEENRSPDQPNLLPIAAIIAIVVIVAAALIVVVWRKRAKAKQAGSAVAQPVEPSL